MVELWLECDSTTTQRDLQSERRFLSLKTGWRNCGWSETQQQHSKHNTKRTKILDVKTCRIFAINIQKWGIIHGENGETVAGVRLDNNTASTKQSERWIIWRQNLRKMKKRRICRIFGNTHENEEYITATLWLERRFNNNTELRNRRKNRLEMFVPMGTTLSWWTGINAGLRVISKNVGITNCRRQ